MTSLFGHSVRSELLLLYVAEAIFCFVIVYLILGQGWGQGLPVPHGDALMLAAALSLSAGLVSGASGLYEPSAWRRAGRFLGATLVAAALLAVLTVVAMLIFAPGDLEVLGATGFLGLITGFIAALVLTRAAFSLIVRSGLLRRRIAVVRGPGGALPVEREIAAGLARHDPFELAFVVPHGAPFAEALSPERLRRERIYAVIGGPGTALPDDLRETGVEQMSDGEFLEQRLNRVEPGSLPEGWLAATRTAREGRIEAVLRRALDIAGSLAIVVATLPLLLLTAIAIKLDSQGPVFYRQERVGKGGSVFTLFKFRSMRVDAEVGGAPRWATKGDDRVTRVGRVLRVLRIDEIPQVINVLRGDMALVGPRPERPAFVEQLAAVIPHYNDRAVVKPGITGWAQVNYPYGASVDDARAKLAYDLYYIRRRSLFLDALILVATVRVVLFQEGAR